MSKLKEKRIGIVELRKNFKKYLDLVNDKGWTIVIENYRKPIATLERFSASRSEHNHTENEPSPDQYTNTDTVQTDVARSLRDDDDRLGHDYDDLEGFIPG
jgi:hypothetical protein